MEFACAALGYYLGDNTFVFASFYAMTGGVILGWAAVTFGSLELLRVYKDNPRAINTAIIHGSINSCVVIVYTVIAYSRYKSFPVFEPDGIALLALKAGIVHAMFLGNYFGGNLVLKYKVAIQNGNS